MGEYWRYFFTERSLTLAEVGAAFAALDPRFTLSMDPAAGNVADLLYGDDVYAELELNTPHGDLYLEDVEALREQLADAGPDEAVAVARIEGVFSTARGMLALRPTDFGVVHFDRIAPIWDRLFDQSPGLLQVDDEAYYEADGVLLRVAADDRDQAEDAG